MKPKTLDQAVTLALTSGALSEVKERIIMQVKALIADRVATAIARDPQSENVIMSLYFDIVRRD